MKKTRIVVHPANPDGSVCLQAQYKRFFVWHVITAAWVVEDLTTEEYDSIPCLFKTKEECIVHLKTKIDEFHKKNKSAQIINYPDRGVL